MTARTHARVTGPTTTQTRSFRVHNNTPVWIQCQEVGCANGIGVHWRHVDNFADRYYCPEHPEAGEAIA